MNVYVDLNQESVHFSAGFSYVTSRILCPKTRGMPSLPGEDTRGPLPGGWTL